MSRSQGFKTIGGFLLFAALISGLQFQINIGRANTVVECGTPLFRNYPPEIYDKNPVFDGYEYRKVFLRSGGLRESVECSDQMQKRYMWIGGAVITGAAFIFFGIRNKDQEDAAAEADRKAGDC